MIDAGHLGAYRHTRFLGRSYSPLILVCAQGLLAKRSTYAKDLFWSQLGAGAALPERIAAAEISPFLRSERRQSFRILKQAASHSEVVFFVARC